MELNTGDILAFSDHSITGIIVRAFTLSNIDHVGMVYENNLFEALREGVVLTPLSEVLKRKSHIYHCALTYREKQIISTNRLLLDSFVQNENLKPYDMKGTVWLGIDNILKIFGKAESPGKRFCSELIIEARKAVKLMDSSTKSCNWSPDNVVKKIQYKSINLIN